MKTTILFALFLANASAASAQSARGKLVDVAQVVRRQHTVHVLVCTRPGPQDLEPQLRIKLACKQDMPKCVQPLAASQGYMEDLDDDLIYEGQNVRVEWLDGKDGAHNVVGAYSVQSSSAEKCEVR